MKQSKIRKLNREGWQRVLDRMSPQLENLYTAIKEMIYGQYLEKN